MFVHLSAASIQLLFYDRKRYLDDDMKDHHNREFSWFGWPLNCLSDYVQPSDNGLSPLGAPVAFGSRWISISKTWYHPARYLMYLCHLFFDLHSETRYSSFSDKAFEEYYDWTETSNYAYLAKSTAFHSVRNYSYMNAESKTKSVVCCQSWIFDSKSFYCKSYDYSYCFLVFCEKCSKNRRLAGGSTRRGETTGWQEVVN